MSTQEEAISFADDSAEANGGRSRMRVIGWFSVGMVVAAVSIYLGNELRSRYKFNRRTPYDFYSNPGQHHAGEFGVGI